MEKSSANTYNQAALECGAAADASSKQLFERLIGDEEDHFADFDRELENVKRFGPSYLALQKAPATEAVR